MPGMLISAVIRMYSAWHMESMSASSIRTVIATVMLLMNPAL